jgi:hypothetical protein
LVFKKKSHFVCRKIGENSDQNIDPSKQPDTLCALGRPVMTYYLLLMVILNFRSPYLAPSCSNDDQWPPFCPTEMHKRYFVCMYACVCVHRQKESGNVKQFFNHFGLK